METIDNNEILDKLAKTDMGIIKVADEVVAIIAGLSATEVNGVAGMSGGVSAGIAEMLGRKNLSKGVKVEVGEKETAIDLFVIVDFGATIPDVAQQIQRNVKNAVESMTGLKVIEINIHVQGVAFDKPESKDEEHSLRLR